MVAQVQREYVAAGIRQQMETLRSVMEEMEVDRLAPEALAWRLRSVELGLRRLRETA